MFWTSSTAACISAASRRSGHSPRDVRSVYAWLSPCRAAECFPSGRDHELLSRGALVSNKRLLSERLLRKYHLCSSLSAPFILCLGFSWLPYGFCEFGRAALLCVNVFTVPHVVNHVFKGGQVDAKPGKRGLRRLRNHPRAYFPVSTCEPITTLNGH